MVSDRTGMLCIKKLLTHNYIPRMNKEEMDMSAATRRSEIINILRDRHRINASELASMLNVSTRTIHNDVQALTYLYPIRTQVGGGGGIFS